MKTTLIRQYRRLRVDKQLAHPCVKQYAFVGMGSHSMANLYPVLGMLRVPIKYVCVTSSRKAELVGRNAFMIPGEAIPTTSLDTMLEDPEVAGVLVSASPAAHYGIVREVMQLGKSLFIEKPPCGTLCQLEELAGMQNQMGSTVFVGMQKRFAPAVRRLKRCLKGENVCNYMLRYCVGRYPEGDAVTELFIHPVDLLTYLFGAAEVLSHKCVAGHTHVLMLKHGDVVGTVELSNGYSWATPVEKLIVHVETGVYALPSIDTLVYRRGGMNVAGIPMDKVVHSCVSEKCLCCHDSFSPVLESSPWVEHGFYHELKAFVGIVEKSGDVRRVGECPTLHSLLPVYQLLECLRSG